MNNKCPKCGGTSGYSYSRLEKVEMIGQWREPEDNMQEKEECSLAIIVKTPKTIICDDCGKRIKNER